MTTLSDYAKDLLARALCVRQPALPTSVYVALGTGGSDATGVTGEPASSGYARQPISFTGSGAQQSAAQIEFAFSGAVGTLSHIGPFDAVAGGNPLSWAALPTPATLNGAGIVTIPAGSISVLGD